MRAVRCRTRRGPVLHLGFGPSAEVVGDPHARRADDLSRYGRRHRPAHAVLHPLGPARHRLRVPPRPDAHSLRHASREFPVERTGDVPSQARGIPHLARRRQLFDAVVQAARGPRVPPRRAVQQPRPGRHPRLELRARTAGVDHRSAVHADLGHGGRRRDVRNDALVVRPRSPAFVFDGLPRHGQRRPRPPQHRPLVLRLLPRLHSRPLRAGLSALLLRRGTLRREHLGQGRVVRVAQPLRAGHHARGAGQILQDQRHKALPRNLRRTGTLLGFAAGNRGQRRAAHRAARKEPHDLPVAPAAGRHGRRGAENRPRPRFAFRRDRPPYGRGTDGLSYGAGLDPSVDGRRPRLVDRVPPFHAFRTARQLATVLHGPRRRCAPHGGTAAKYALSHGFGRGVRMGRVQSRRPLYGRGAARRGSRTAVRNARPVGDSRIGVGRSYGGVVRSRHGRQRHVDRPHRLRRPAPDYRGGLHHPFEPAGRGRQALLRLDRLGPRRGPLLRPDGPPRIPHHHLGLRLLRARPGGRRSAADDLRPPRLPRRGAAGRRR